MSEEMKSVLLAAFFFPSAAAVLIFAMKCVSAVLQARTRAGDNETYSRIATENAAARAETAAALASLGTALAETQSRLAVVERILKEVE